MKTKQQAGGIGLTIEEINQIHMEIEDQPVWRARADKEMDYADGNQLDSELLRLQGELGIPPAIEDLIGPALLSIQGYEATIRTDWRVTPSGETGGQDVADALNSRLNQAERESKADAACSEAFRPQLAIGLGWVEVGRESDPFKFPYRCKAVNRNEIHWDMNSSEADLSDARWLRRMRWMNAERLADVFPKHKELILLCGKYGAGWREYAASWEGGMSTGLSNSWGEASASTVNEQHWYNTSNKEVGVSEFWYRRWETVPVIKTPDGRVVEYDEDNEAHNYAIATGMSKPHKATIARVRRSYWLGPSCLDDSPTPYPHRHFPYVPFWGFREDSSRVPYGYVRGMVYQQDSLNSGTAKLRWGLGAVRTTYTKGATKMTPAQLRKMVGRSDASIELDAEAMARPGAMFKVERDFQLNSQQMQLLDNARAAIGRIGPATSGFMGRQGTATSGLQEQTQVEQSNQSLGRMMDMFRAGRTQVGELLLSLLIEDMGEAEQTIVIEGDAVKEDRTVVLNKLETDPSGYTYLSNDLRRTRLKVALEDVPSTNSYRGQQLNAMSEAVKSLPAQYQAAMLPFMVGLMDVPYKADVVNAIRDVSNQQTPEQAQQRIEQGIKDGVTKAGLDIKARELDLKDKKTNAEIDAIVAKGVQVGVQTAYSAMQAAQVVATTPQTAPLADLIMQSAGYKRPSPMGDDPNFPQPQGVPVDPGAVPPVQENTSPEFPPVPQQPGTGMEGIETQTTADNMA